MFCEACLIQGFIRLFLCFYFWYIKKNNFLKPVLLARNNFSQKCKQFDQEKVRVKIGLRKRTKEGSVPNVCPFYTLSVVLSATAEKLFLAEAILYHTHIMYTWPHKHIVYLTTHTYFILDHTYILYQTHKYIYLTKLLCILDHIHRFTYCIFDHTHKLYSWLHTYIVQNS